MYLTAREKQLNAGIRYIVEHDQVWEGHGIREDDFTTHFYVKDTVTGKRTDGPYSRWESADREATRRNSS